MAYDCITYKKQQPEDLIELGTKVLEAWRAYTDESLFVYANTEGQPHNTITPIARKRGDEYELDLVLRNNITTEEFLTEFIILTRSCTTLRKKTSG